jgi:hypothetical protein
VRFLTGLAAVLALGGAVAAVGSVLGPLATIVSVGLAAYLVQAGGTGAVLPVQTLIRSRVDPADQGMAMTAVTIAKFAVQVAVSVFVTVVWSGDTALPGGWVGVAAIIAAGGIGALAAAAGMRRASMQDGNEVRH